METTYKISEDKLEIDITETATHTRAKEDLVNQKEYHEEELVKINDMLKLFK